MSRMLARSLGPVWVSLVLLFLIAPLVVVVGASFNGREQDYLNFPPSHPSLAWYGRMDPDQLRALGVSVMLAAGCALISVVLGVLAAFGLVRAKFPGKALVSAILRSPLQIPAVVIGVSFMRAYYMVGDATGVFGIGTLGGLMLAHSFMAMPYVIGAVSSVLLRFNTRLEEAALSLGASRLSVMRRVVLPILMPGIYTGAIYAFLVSFGDVPVSLFLSSAGYTTLPVQIFQAMQFDFNPAVLAISSVTIAGSLVLMIGLQRLVGMDTLLRAGGNK